MTDSTQPIERTAGALAALGLCALLGACATPSQQNCEPREPGTAQCLVPQPRRLGLLAETDPPVQVVVDARCRWNHTGVQLQQGAVYAISARVRRDDPWVDKGVESDLSTGWKGAFWGLVGRLFQPGARAPDLPLYALVAAQGQAGRIHSVAGHEARLQSETADDDPPTELLFFANDWPGMYHNNHGCVDVEVKRVPGALPGPR